MSLLSRCSLSTSYFRLHSMDRGPILARIVPPWLVVALLCLLSPLPSASAAPFRIIGYLTENAPPERVPFSLLTHINYAFLIPHDNGSLRPLANRDHLARIIRLAHGHGVKVLISVGGWGQDRHFEAMAASAPNRRRFIRDLIHLVMSMELDGVDLDWEYPNPGKSSRNFQALTTELRAALARPALLTAAVAAGDDHGEGIPATTFTLFDFFNIMAYDNDGENHSSLEDAHASLAYWRKRGLSREKIVLGLPFYSRPGEIPYRTLVATDPNAAHADAMIFRGVRNNYNGLATVTSKTQLARKSASGVMFWRIEDDSMGDNSLIATIHRVAAER